MNYDLKIFNYFVDDLLSSEVNLLHNELDLLLMQYIFNSIDLDLIKDMDFREDIFFVLQFLIMKFFYEKLWVPFFGGILSKFVFLIEGKKQKVKKKKKQNH